MKNGLSKVTLPSVIVGEGGGCQIAHFGKKTPQVYLVVIRE